MKLSRDLIVAVLTTLFILFLFQCGGQLTAPGIKLGTFNSNDLTQLLNFLGGGGLKKVSIFAVGISPYITSQIIIHMMSNDIVPHLSEYRKMGERGRARLEFYTRLMTFPFAVMTGIGTFFLIGGSGMGSFIAFDGTEVATFTSLSFFQCFLMVFMVVSGTYITLFLGDIISKKGVGNGTTLLIMSGIISAFPDSMFSAYTYFGESNTIIPQFENFMKYFKMIIYLIFYLIIILLLVYVNGSVRKIPIQQTGKGMVLDREKLPYLPIKLIPAGVVPVVFAGSIMVIPTALGELISSSYLSVGFFIKSYLSLSSPTGLVIYSFLIISFSFFCSHMQLNTEEMTRNFQISGRFIPGIRIGQKTYNYLRGVINRMNCFGAPFLAIVTILPNLINMFVGLPTSIALGGTGLIILVSGSIQIWESLTSIYISSNYKTGHSQFEKIEAENLGSEEVNIRPSWQLW